MKKIETAATILAIAAVSVISAAAPALARPADDPAAGGWRVEVTPYIWMVGLAGEIQAGPASGTIGASFSDILNSLDLGLMGLLQVRKGRVGFAFDGQYSRLTKSGTTSGAVGESESVQATLVSQLYSITVSYRILDGRVPLDVGAGARVMPNSATLEATSGEFAGEKASGGNTAVDGFIGARLTVPLAGRWSLEGYADIGAGDSKLSWQAIGGLKVGLSGTVSLKLGYRYLSIHNESPDLSTTIGEGGFYLGAGIRL